MLEARKISKSFGSLNVFRDYSVSFDQGFYVVTGSNGRGKTTLLYILAGVLEPDSGKVLFNGRNIRNDKRAYFKKVGFAFQSLKLVSGLTVEQNILLTVPDPGRDYSENLDKLLDDLKLSRKRRQPVDSLSGGEQRKVALARAMVHEPEVLLADEPTADLDPQNTRLVFRILEEYSKKAIVVMTTNDSSFRRRKRFKLVDLEEAWNEKG